MSIWEKPVLRQVCRMAGWTVIEVLIGLTAIAVIFLLTAPGLNTLSQKYHLKKTSSNLLSSMALAQDEAARRRGITRMCPSSDGNTCREDGNWNRGWIVYLDSNANFKPEATEILEMYGATNEKIRIQAEGAFTFRATFNIDGSPKVSDGLNAGRFKVCIADDETRAEDLQVDEEGWIEADVSNLACSKV